MPLYKLTPEINRVQIRQFEKEKDLQNLVEKNLEKLFGILFLETEYSIPNGRIDTLCIDEMGVPVIIEYKKKKDLSAVIQGLFYIDWLRNNKRTYEMIVREKLGNKIDVDWRPAPRLLIIADEFDQKEAISINQINATVELIKYSYYGDLIAFDQINISKSLVLTNSVGAERPKSSTDSELLTLDDVLSKGSVKVREIILKLREYVFEISDEIDEKIRSSMVGYYSKGKGMIWIKPATNKFVIHLRKGEYDNKYNMIKHDGWGGYPELHVPIEQYNEDIENYIKQIIDRAYSY